MNEKIEGFETKNKKYETNDHGELKSPEKELVDFWPDQFIAENPTAYLNHLNDEFENANSSQTRAIILAEIYRIKSIYFKEENELGRQI